MFVVAGVSKIMDLAAFAELLRSHSGLPVGVIRAIAAFLPWLELICGLCLALGYAVREAALILFILLVVFLAYALLHWNDPDCGCFVLRSPIPPLPPWWTPVRNVLLLLCSLRVAWR